MNPVLDASVLVAAISPAEHRHAAARALMGGIAEEQAFLVPTIFNLEVLAALSRRGEPDDLLDAVAALLGGPRFHACPLDNALLGRAADVARRGRFRAYDAIYVALALVRDQPLFTLDDDVVARCAAVYPQLAVTGAGPPSPA